MGHGWGERARRRTARGTLALLLAAAPLAGADWSQWRGGPQRAGAAREAPVLSGLAASGALVEAWRSEPLPSGWGHQGGCVVGQGSPVVSGGKVYLYINWPDPASVAGGEVPGKPRIPDRVQDTVLCLNLADGKTVWKAELPGRSWRWGCSATLAVASGKVVALGSRAEGFCLDAVTGKELWRMREEAQPGLGKYTDVICAHHGSALIHDGLAFMVGGKQCDRLFACDLATGAVHWSAPVGRQAWSAPAVWSQGQQWTLLAGGAAWDPATGKPIWKGLAHGWGTPAVEGDRCATMGGKGLLIYRLTAAGPERLADFEVSNGSGCPAIFDGRVYACGARPAPAAPSPAGPASGPNAPPANAPAKPAPVGVVLCANAADGKLLWETTGEDLSVGGGQWSFTAVTVGGGVVCVLSGDRIWLFAAADGKRLAGPLKVDNLKGGTSLAVAGEYLITRGWKAVVAYKAAKP